MLSTAQAAKAAGGPTRIEKAKIGLIQFQLSPPKADIESSVVISDYQQVTRVTARVIDSRARRLLHAGWHILQCIHLLPSPYKASPCTLA